MHQTASVNGAGNIPHLQETRGKGREVLLHRLVQIVVRDAPHELRPVVIGDRNGRAAGLQLHRAQLAKIVILLSSGIARFRSCAGDTQSTTRAFDGRLITVLLTTLESR